MKIFDQFGRQRDLSHLSAVEKLENLKKTSGSNPWPVIEKCLEIWKSTNPRGWKAYLVEVQDVRETRKDSEFGSTVDKETGGTLRYTLDIPEKVMYMIRMMYTADELPMTRQFFQEWARRFPFMKVAQKQ